LVVIGLNHALAGGLIGYYVPLPAALPLAVASHFILDALPHYGLPYAERERSKFWKRFFTADFFLAASLMAIPIASHNYPMLICGIAAVLPDFVWVLHVIKKKTFDLGEHEGWYRKWHAKIQRYERPWGIWVELPLVAALFYWVWRVSF
jgi:hypothetical protein